MRREAGTTLVEVVVSLLLLGFGALALAASLLEAERTRGWALGATAAQAGAETWTERWRLGDPASGSGSVAAGPGPWSPSIEWSSRSVGPCLVEARVRATAGRSAIGSALLVTRLFRGEGCAE
ncbi:MAG: hypothetical protein R3199_01875 [Gemmatimonadota bacterium]|nr:hypothetical protein [Gemmatimonadota bacterium]